MKLVAILSPALSLASRATVVLAVILILAAGARNSTSVHGAPQFPNTDPGRRAAAFLEAFNSGREEAVRAFFQANLAAEALARRPMEERLAVFRQMRDEHGKLTPERIVESRENRVRVVVASERGMRLDLAFDCEVQPPHALLGLRIEAGSPGEEPEAGTVPQPMSEGSAVAYWRAQLDSLARADAFSGAALLARGDSILFRAAYGYASRERRIRNRTDTKFNLGSINKIFTKLAIGQLVEQGKVRLDDPIDRYLPDYPRQVASRVTVRQLLEHRGGIADIFGESYERADHSKLRTVADWMRLVRDEPLRFEPGTRQEYSNGGYVVLGAIIEKASGEDYYDYMRRHVYGPLGMKDTDHFAGDVANLATGYTRHAAPGAETGGEWRDNAFSRPRRGSPAGGGYSTLEDLLRFTQALRASKLLRPETISNGFAELGADEKGEAGLGIGGGAPGINAAVELQGPYTIIVLANLDPPAAQRAAQVRRWLPGDGEPLRLGPGPPRGDGSVKEGQSRIRPDDAPGPDLGPQRTQIPRAGVEVERLGAGHLPVVLVNVNGRGRARVLREFRVTFDQKHRRVRLAGKG